MTTPPLFGSTKCPYCKGTGLNPWGGRCDCDDGWLPPKKGPEVVLGASDAIVPIVQDNEFSKEALDKVIRSGKAASMRRTILLDLHHIFPKGMSSSQFEERYEWLHQSCSAALTSLHKEGLTSVVKWRLNKRGNREGIYTLSAIAHGAWEST